jgi:hypothetical protein
MVMVYGVGVANDDGYDHGYSYDSSDGGDGNDVYGVGSVL